MIKWIGDVFELVCTFLMAVVTVCIGGDEYDDEEDL